MSGADRELVRRTRDASLRKAGVTSGCPRHRSGMSSGSAQRALPLLRVPCRDDVGLAERQYEGR